MACSIARSFLSPSPSSSSPPPSSSCFSFLCHLRSLRSRGCIGIGVCVISRSTLSPVRASAKPQQKKAARSSPLPKRPPDLQRGRRDGDRYRSRDGSDKNVGGRNRNSSGGGGGGGGGSSYGRGRGVDARKEQSWNRDQVYGSGRKNSRNYVEEEEEEDDDDDDDEYGDNEEEEEEEEDDDDDDDVINDDDGYDIDPESLLLPRPPAGFILDRDGSSVALMAPPNKRITSIFDPATKLFLDCLIRRVFSSSDARQCFLLCPLDTPVQILRIDGEDKILKEISDEELEDIFPTASYELAKRRLHLVFSGYCLTLRGGFCYAESDLMDVNTVYGGTGDHSLHEGVEVARFRMKESEYLVYSPFDPLMFVAFKDEDTGDLIIADDDLLEDEAVLDAISEEKEFQAYVDEEVAMNESLKEDDRQFLGHIAT